MITTVRCIKLMLPISLLALALGAAACSSDSDSAGSAGKPGAGGAGTGGSAGKGSGGAAGKGTGGSAGSKTGTTAKKGGGATTGTAAKTSGQKAGTKATANQSKATSAGATTGGTASKAKNGGAHSPTAAKSSSEKVGAAATAALSQAEDKGEQFEQATCDTEFEGVGFCADDKDLVFCAEGHWYSLDCSVAATGAFCGEDLSTQTVDCYQESEFSSEDGLTCDDSTDGVAFCADDDQLVFCNEGSWWQLSCSSIVSGAFCGEDPDSLTVDCAVEGEDL